MNDHGAILNLRSWSRDIPNKMSTNRKGSNSSTCHNNIKLMRQANKLVKQAAPDKSSAAGNEQARTAYRDAPDNSRSCSTIIATS